MQAIGMRKQALVERALSAGGIEAYPGSVRWVRELRDAGTRTAVVSSSTNAGASCARPASTQLFDVIVDGRDIARLGLSGKPAPDGFLEAAQRLAVAPARASSWRTRSPGWRRAGRAASASWSAWRAARRPRTLRSAGADIVVADLAEMLR